MSDERDFWERVYVAELASFDDIESAACADKALVQWERRWQSDPHDVVAQCDDPLPSSPQPVDITVDDCSQCPWCRPDGPVRLAPSPVASVCQLGNQGVTTPCAPPQWCPLRESPRTVRVA